MLVNRYTPIDNSKPDLRYAFFRYAKEHQLKFVSISKSSYWKPWMFEQGRGRPQNPRELANIDAAKTKMYAGSRRELSEIFLDRL